MFLETLYTYTNYWRSYPALIAAQYSGVQINVVSAPPGFEPGNQQKSEGSFKFPLGKVPVFEEDGFQITESSAIAHYVATEVLRGTSPQDSALIQQWVNFADVEIVPSVATWVYPTLGAADNRVTQRARETIQGVLSVLDKHLHARTFMVGERVTLADISMVCALFLLYKQVLEPSLRGNFANVTRWFITCVHQAQFSAVLGEVQLCEKAAQCEVKATQEDPPKEKNITEEEERDPTEEVMAAEPKAKDPFTSLAKSPFVLDEFKRKYSNEDTLTEALPYFWKNLDQEGWSLWYSEYKFPSELGKVFMSCNLITGMFQRLDRLRKHAFASVALFGQDGNSSISGVWLLRGHQLAFELCDDWKVDYESYSWRKLEPDNEETKTLVKEYFAWEGEFKHVGKPFSQGKIFK
ncbi:elongation factor 1-gamma isoform X1 [Amia ocellicauda]|uniref:elongation factor 1-gamma isoform X1 n=1 Tax=Amia ocellicauda TaxID=2972642 RepID=UPI003463D585